MEKNKEIFTKLLKIDRDLIKIDKKLSILKIITPSNIEEEKEKFITSNWVYIPELKYEKININLKKNLENLKNIKIPKSDLSWIYKIKKDELINKIKFLEAFEKQDVKKMNKYSVLLYWDIIKANLEYSKNLISNKWELYEEKDFIYFEEITQLVKEYNKLYNLNLKVEEKNIVSRFTIIQSEVLLVKYNAIIWKKEIKAIMAHEIEAHHLRRINSKKQKLKIFYYWTAKYINTEEWLATYNQDFFLDKNDEKYYFNAERYYFIDYAKNHSYTDLLEELKKYYNADYSKIFDMILRFKRWIKNVKSNYCYTKDLIYIDWHLEILDFINNWWDLKELYFWKIWVKDLEEIRNSDIVKIDLNKLKFPLFY